MNKVLTLTVGEIYQENCYILYNEKDCVVIDPGDEFEYINENLVSHSIKPTKILLTHGHFDHVGAVKKLKEEYGAAIYMNTADNHLLSFYRTKDFDVDINVGEIDFIDFGDDRIEIIKTPGHSEGSVCYRIDNLLFLGDTLFAGSIGRCDLPGGNANVMMKTLKNIITNFDAQLVVFPGHGTRTTIEEELKSNYYLKNL